MKRSLARLPLLLAVLAIVAATSVLLQAMPVMVDAAARDLVTSTLAAAPPRDASVRVETGAGDSSSRGAMTAFLEEQVDGLPLVVHQSLDAGAVETDSGTLTVEADPQLSEFATLAAGQWADSADEAVLQARAAAATGIDVGDVVTVDGALEVRVVGLWEPIDATAPHWFGEPGPESGNDDGTPGPLMVSDQAIDRLDSESTAYWVISAIDLRPSQLSAAQSAVGDLAQVVERSGLAERSITVDGDLDGTIGDLRSSLVAAGRLATVPLVLLALIALVTLARIADLLWSVRRGETTLLRGRGTSIRRLVGTAALEAAPLSAVGAAAGLLVPGSSALLAAVVAAVALCLLTVSALVGVRAAVTTVATRRTRALAAGIGVLVIAAAGVSLSQFLLYTNASGANPLGALAPALGILAIAVAAVAVVPPAFRVLESVSTRGSGLGPALAVRHLARDAAVHSTSVLLIVLALGGATLAAGYAGSAGAAERLQRQTATGGDVRVHLDGRPSVDDSSGYLPVVDYGSVPGATSALPALAVEARIGDTPLEFMATSPARQASLPSGTRALEVSLDSLGRGETIDVSAWLADEQGQAILARGDESGDVPVPPGEWSLLAIELHVGGISGPVSIPVSVTSVMAGTTELLDSSRTVRLSVAAPTARVMIVEAEVEPLPVVLTDAASTLLVAPPGATITLALPATGGTIDAVVLATVAAVDGARGSLAAHADLAALGDYLLRTGQRVPQPNEVWISSPIAQVAAGEAALLPTLPAAITTRESGSGMAAASTSVFVLGSAGAALIALLGVAAVAWSLGREREMDGRVLRALGLGDRAVARIRVLELSLATLAASVTGVVAGLVATVVFVPVLARTASLSIDAAVMSVVAVAVLCFVVTSALVGRRSA